ncbi:hypothetical protein MI149_30090 (plasmid) [Mycolicibacterium crocinum]|uniref:Uncharacterized protein n=1 Tax=Mycolicibacterium crocinum TaxID=388459 RepID=A0ABY3TTM3_9MYCO|nr:hypothetical protein [Mycolicibacterium crocinum]ULN44747.1 hypothetical protein MI149_30090 [Mycolicibacterium crocinum]
MIEIRTATEAVTAAQLLIDADTSAGGTDLWQSYAVSPLAAVLLSTAHDNVGFADLATVRDVLGSPASEPDGQSHPGWVSVAQRCPDPLLSSALRRAAGLMPRQRDSIAVSALAALARS